MKTRTIGVSLWSLQALTFLQEKNTRDLMKIIADMGVEYVDLVEDYIPCQPHVHLEKLAVLKKDIKDLDLKVGQVWYYVDPLAQIHQESYERSLTDMKELIRTTALTGARFCIIPFRFILPGLDDNVAHQRYIEWLQDIMPTVEEEGIVLGLECSRSHMLHYAIPTVETVGSKALKLCPDFEAWRLPTSDLPMTHVETAEPMRPASIETLWQLLPYAQPIHAKMISFDELGEELHFPMAEMMEVFNQCEIEDLHFIVEYEGWTPDAFPDLAPFCVEETKKCVDLLRRYLK